MAEDNPIRQLFDSLDTDGDGILSKEDLRTVLPDLDEDKLDEIISKLSSNGSTSLSYEEFEAGFDFFAGGGDIGDGLEEDMEISVMEEDPLDEPNYEDQRKTVREIFDVLDSNADGKFDQDDVKPLLVDCEEYAARDLISHLDQTKSGTVTFAEFDIGFETFCQVLRAAGGKWPAELSTKLSAEAVKYLESHGVAVSFETEPSIHSVASKILTANDVTLANASFSQIKNQLDSNDTLAFVRDEEEEEEERERAEFEAFKQKLMDDLNKDGGEENVLGEDAFQNLEVEYVKDKARHMKSKIKIVGRKYELLGKIGHQLEQENIHIKKRMEDADITLRRCQQELAEMTEAVVEYRSIIADLQERLKNMERESDEYRNTCNELTRQLANEQAARTALEDKLQELQAQLNDATHGRSAESRFNRKDRMGLLNDVRSKLKKQNEDEMAKRLQKLIAQNASLNEKMKKMQAQTDQDRLTIADLRAQLGERSARGLSLKDQMMEDESEEEKSPVMSPRNPDEPIPRRPLTLKRRNSKARTMLKTLRAHGTLKKPATLKIRKRGPTVSGSPEKHVVKSREAPTVSGHRARATTSADLMHDMGGSEHVSEVMSTRPRTVARFQEEAHTVEPMFRQPSNSIDAPPEHKHEQRKGMGASHMIQGRDEGTGTSTPVEGTIHMSFEENEDVKGEGEGMARITAEWLQKQKELEALIEQLRKELSNEKKTREEKEKYIEELLKKIQELEEEIARLKELIKSLRQQLQKIADDNKKKEEIKLVVPPPRSPMASTIVTPVPPPPIEKKFTISGSLQTEITAYAHYLNYTVGDDGDLKQCMPINPKDTELLNKIKDGWVFAKFLNFTAPFSIDCRALNKKKPDADLSKAEMSDNITLVFESCRGSGVQMTDMLTKHLLDPLLYPEQAVELTHRIIRNQLFYRMTLKDHPEMIRLLVNNEEPGDLLKLSKPALLLRWLNFQLTQALTESDVKSILQKHALNRDQVIPSEILHEGFTSGATIVLLLHQLRPEACDSKAVDAVLSEAVPAKRAAMIVEKLQQFGLRPPQIFSVDVLGAHTQTAARLNLLLVAAIFNQCPGLEPLTKAESASMMEDDVSDSREERAFRLWINSMGIGDLNVHNLFSECRDGLVLLRVMDRIAPGSVDWKKVEKKPVNRFQKLTNCNYVISLGKAAPFLFSLVNIGGQDLTDGNKKLTLSVVWQLMHHHITKFLTELYFREFGRKRQSVSDRRGTKASSDDSDALIIDWANRRVEDGKQRDKVSKDPRLAGSAYDVNFDKMKSFHDNTLSNSLFFLHLLYTIEPRIVDWSLVTKGESPEDKTLNARYAISVARKLGATIFLLPEDIVEVKPKMITSFIGSILTIDTLKKV